MVVIIYYHSSRAIQLSKNQVYHERTKHIYFKLHFVGFMKVMKVSTNHNHFDMITKVLLSSKLFHCLDFI